MERVDHQGYAGFWIRVFASIIDTVLILLLIVPILFTIYGDGYPDTEQSLFLGFWDFIFSHIVPAVIIVLFWVYKSATPGKLWLKLRIIDRNSGEALTVRQSIIRYLGYYLASLPLLLGIIWVAFDKKKQGLHDKLAGTVVVISSGDDFGVTTRRGIARSHQNGSLFGRGG